MLSFYYKEKPSVSASKTVSTSHSSHQDLSLYISLIEELHLLPDAELAEDAVDQVGIDGLAEDLAERVVGGT